MARPKRGTSEVFPEEPHFLMSRPCTPSRFAVPMFSAFGASNALVDVDMIFDDLFRKCRIIFKPINWIGLRGRNYLRAPDAVSHDELFTKQQNF